MADSAIIRPSSLDRIARPGRYGKFSGSPGVTIEKVRELGLADVIARKGQETALCAAAAKAFGVDLPRTPHFVSGPEISFVWAGQGRWLAVAPRLPEAGMEALLGVSLAGLASIVDQSDGRAIVRLSGPRVRETLAKGVPIDLHPRAFRTGDAALTLAAQIGVHLWQISDEPSYEIALFRSFAESCWRWLTDSASEFGYEINP